MGVPTNTSILLLYKILLFGSIRGLPFASISSLSSLKAPATSSNEELSSAAHGSNIVNPENSVLLSTISESPTNLQLFIGLPIGNTIYISTQNPSEIEETSNGIPSPDASLDIQQRKLSSTRVSEPSGSSNSSNIKTLGIVPSIATTSSSGSSAVQNVNKNSKSDNLKRESRDTISISYQEPRFMLTQNNLARLTSICKGNLPSSFADIPSIPETKSEFPCVEILNKVQPPTLNPASSSEESVELSNGIKTEYSRYSPFQSSSVLTRPNPVIFRNNMFRPQENPNMLLALKLLHQRKDQKKSDENDSAQSQGCFKSTEINTANSLPTSTSFVDKKTDIESKQTLQIDSLQNRANVQNTLSPNRMNRLNNILVNAQVPENNNIAFQILQKNKLKCDNPINQSNYLKTDSENVLETSNYNEDCRGYPQLETITIQNNMPFTQNINMFRDPIKEFDYENSNNLGSSGSFNLARNNKYSLNENNDNGITAEVNNNQGCPQLILSPCYNEESLLNKQLCQNCNNGPTRALPNNSVNVDNNNIINQNIQGSPQLLSDAQNNLYVRKLNEPFKNYNELSCVDKLVPNLEDNFNEIFTPNENLAQALKMVKNLKTVNVPASTINILPYGATLIDGKPLVNDFVTVKSISCPTELQNCSCSDSSNTKKLLTIQDICSSPFTKSPVNSFSCITPLRASVPMSNNVMPGSSLNPINTSPPIITNIAPSIISLAQSAPKTSSLTNGFSISNPPIVYAQERSCKSNIQPMFTLLSTPNDGNAIVTPNLMPVESLPQVSFVNNLPSSTSSVTPSLSMPDNYITSISNLPIVSNSIQPGLPLSYPLVPTNPQAYSLPGPTSAFLLNNLVTSITQNIISKLMSTQIPFSAAPLAKQTPVNPFIPNLISETSSKRLPVYLDNPELSNSRASPPLNLPIACNEYLPPIGNSAIVPLSTFNPNLFCIESDTYDCVPFALSITDQFYPEVSFMSALGSSDLSSLITASSLPKSPSVIKLNNIGRDAKEFDQLLNCIMS